MLSVLKLTISHSLFYQLQMQIIDAKDLETLPPGGWETLLKRPAIEVASLTGKVTAILDEIKEHGDKAVLRFTKMFDGVTLATVAASDAEKAEAYPSSQQ